MKTTVTSVYEVVGSKRRVVNTVHGGTYFVNLPWTKNENLSDPDTQMKVAKELVSMWRRSGYKPEATYEVEQTSK